MRLKQKKNGKEKLLSVMIASIDIQQCVIKSQNSVVCLIKGDTLHIAEMELFGSHQYIRCLTVIDLNLQSSTFGAASLADKALLG